jgi:hypothetical protein
MEFAPTSTLAADFPLARFPSKAPASDRAPSPALGWIVGQIARIEIIDLPGQSHAEKGLVVGFCFLPSSFQLFSTPARALAVETSNLERTLSILVTRAYGPTPAGIALM